MATEQEIENEIVKKGLDAPRLSPSDIDDVIDYANYYRFPNSVVTVCCLTLTNGFNVVGYSACVSMENYDEEIGQKVAFENARRLIWQLEGYRLKDSMAI